MKLNLKSKKEIRKEIVQNFYKIEYGLFDDTYISKNIEIDEKIKLPKEILLELLTPDKSASVSYFLRFYTIIIEYFDLNEIPYQELNSDVKSYLKEALINCSLSKKANVSPKIQLPKDYLEGMLFYKTDEIAEVIDNQVHNYLLPMFDKIKMQVIDLSELDFSYLVWDVERFLKIYGEDSKNEILKYKDYPVLLSRYGTLKIDLSYSNAKIDFSKNDKLFISDCNFKGIDLSKSNIEKIRKVIVLNSNFDNTNFPLDKMVAFQNYGKYINCSFLGNNFDQVCLEDQVFRNHNFDSCNFSGTKLNIELQKKSTNPELNKLIKNKLLVGCYLEGKLLKSADEILKDKTAINEQYKDYVANYKGIIDQSLQRIKK